MKILLKYWLLIKKVELLFLSKNNFLTLYTNNRIIL